MIALGVSFRTRIRVSVNPRPLEFRVHLRSDFWLGVCLVKPGSNLRIGFSVKGLGFEVPLSYISV